MTTNTNAALTDAVRVPLDSLHADAEYLCARLLDKSLTREEVVTAIRSRIDAAKAALTTAAAVPPEGWVTVPVEPTDAMKHAAQKADMDHSEHADWLHDEWPDFLRVWNAMLAAAPKAEPVQTDHFPDAKKMVAQPAGEYPPLPEPYHVAYDDIDKEDVKCFAEGQLRAYVDTDRAMRAQAAPDCDTPRYCQSVQRCTAQDEKRAAPTAVAPLGEYPHEQMDAMALARYKVVPSDASMFWRHMVVAGDGTRQLYVGREVECQNMARKFAGAFLDGAFAFHSIASAPTTQAAPAAVAGPSDAQELRVIADFLGGAKDRLGRPDAAANDQMRAAREAIRAAAVRHGVAGGHHTYIDQCAAVLAALANKIGGAA